MDLGAFEPARAAGVLAAGVGVETGGSFGSERFVRDSRIVTCYRTLRYTLPAWALSFGPERLPGVKGSIDGAPGACATMRRIPNARLFPTG